LKYVPIAIIAATAVALRVVIARKRRSRRLVSDEVDGAAPVASGTSRRPILGGRFTRSSKAAESSLDYVGMVAMREIKERVRGRIFKVGTLIILAVIAAAIIIPAIHRGGGPTKQAIGLVGAVPPAVEHVIATAGSRVQDSVNFVSQPSLAATKANLRSGKLAFAIVDADELLLNEPASASSSPADPVLVQAVAQYLGVLAAYRAAKLTPAQAAAVDGAKPVPVRTLQPSSKGSTKTTSVIGLVLLFFMLTQYNTWILIGVMQEKSSRVVEVLLATLRPLQLLGGKVLGIGLVAFAQATVIVGFALIVGAAVGSDLLHGAAPLVLACQLLWLILGYAFYCWVYAAAGSTAERQDQVQTLAIPLSIPILLGYIFSISVASSGNASVFFKILAYLPPTAPFCMPVLVALNDVAWWGFVASVLITIAATVAMAIFAARIYKRAVLRTGGRVRLRELFARPAH
jgi:ABC-2 type transport system permease protein